MQILRIKRNWFTVNKGDDLQGCNAEGVALHEL